MSVFLLFAFLTVSCGDGEGDMAPNHPPEAPANPSPLPYKNVNESTINLFWTARDPDRDPLLYDVYFGDESPPSRIVKNLEIPTTVVSLQQNKTYYWFVVAKDGRDSTVGPEWEFNVVDPAILPHISTLDASEVTNNSVSLEGRVFDDGGSPILERGFFLGRFPNTESTGEKFKVEGTPNRYYLKLSNLQSNGVFYFRAYARNKNGISYGIEKSFTTWKSSTVSGEFTDPRDNNTYSFQRIGKQLWMTENLAYLPYVDPVEEGGYLVKFYYVYGYEGQNVENAKATDNYKTYGVLYNWPAAMNDSDGSTDVNIQGACPDGWHLPADREWNELSETLGGDMAAGVKLKNEGTEYWSAPNSLADNSSGFNALPGGEKFPEIGFRELGERGFWWTATEFSRESAKRRALYHNSVELINVSNPKSAGQSIRCIKD